MARAGAPKGAARKRLPDPGEIRRMINVVPDAGAKEFLAGELARDGARRGRFEALARRSEFDARGEDYHARVTEMLDRAREAASYRTTRPTSASPTSRGTQGRARGPATTRGPRAYTGRRRRP